MRNTEINKFKFQRDEHQHRPYIITSYKLECRISRKTGDKAEISRLRSSTSGTSSGNARSWTWAQ